MKGFLRFLLVVSLLVVIAIGGVVWSGLSFINTPASEETDEVVFEVKPGESFKTIARRLEEKGLIQNSFFLEAYVRFKKLGPKIRVGEYSIKKNATPAQVLEVVSSGKSIEYSITVQEGFNIFEISELVEKRGIGPKEEFLKLVRDPKFIRSVLGEERPSLEGYLFPETYNITKFTGVEGLIKMMVARFKENYARLAELGLPEMSQHDLVTLASIIEKETGAPEERPMISSVFHNRMKINMKLQTDPTVIYGIWEKTGKWNRNISREDLLTPNRYNTYSFTGLPFGPIANPGLEALKAAANPATSEYLFFVSRNDGTHVFSKDLKGHLRAVSDFQLNSKARQGKSWRDLQKRPASGAVATEPKRITK